MSDLNSKEKLRTPDFEIRANIFAYRAKGEGMKIEKAHRFDKFDYSVENSLKDWIKNFDALQKLFTEINAPEPPLGIMTPGQLADELDQKSSTECIVEVYALSDRQKLLKEFLEKVFKHAADQGGKLNGEFMRLLSTTNSKDYITYLGSEGEGLSTLLIHFSFS
jgi:hypothetical protein